MAKRKVMELDTEATQEFRDEGLIIPSREDNMDEVAEDVQVVEVVEVDANGRKKKVDLSYEELDTKGLKNKSQIIRYLDAEGYSRSAIAMFLNVRYQHVRNVLVTPLKKG